jgi:hypothetical protein
VSVFIVDDLPAAEPVRRCWAERRIVAVLGWVVLLVTLAFMRPLGSVAALLTTVAAAQRDVGGTEGAGGVCVLSPVVGCRSGRFGSAGRA